jgi:hypothetical protein
MSFCIAAGDARCSYRNRLWILACIREQVKKRVGVRPGSDNVFGPDIASLQEDTSDASVYRRRRRSRMRVQSGRG